MNYSLQKRGETYFLKFYLPDPKAPRGLKQVLRSTGADTRSKAHRAAPDIIETALLEHGAGDERSRQAFTVLREAALLAAKGHLGESSARQFVQELMRISRGRDLASHSVRGWIDHWLENCGVKESSLVQYQGSLNQFVDFLGDDADRDLMALDSSDVERFRKSLIDSGRRARTIQTTLQRVRSCLASAVEDGAIPSNPVILGKASKKAIRANDQGERKKPFSAKQIAELLEVASGDWVGMVLVGLYTGARIGDACALRWEAVDLHAKTITLTEQKKNGRKILLPIHPGLHNWLMEQPSSDKPRTPVFPSLINRSKGYPSRVFGGLIEKAGIENPVIEPPKAKKGESQGNAWRPYGFHSLRRSNVSLMANRGVAAEIRQQITGHESEDVHAIYTTLELETLRQALDTLPTLEK